MTPAPGSALWNGQAHMPTARRNRVTIAAGEGAWLVTSTGHRLLDATAGLWHANIGHGRESMARAAYDQMRRLETYHVFGRFANEPALRLADRLAAIGPTPDCKVMFTSGGSDSIELACKLARLHWQLDGRPDKTLVVSRRRSYHGLHAFGTSVAGIDRNRDGYGTRSLVPETARIPAQGLDQAIAELTAIGPERIAAIITEPVQGTGGVHGPEDGYLEGLQAFARGHEILLVVDEVVTGFGRTGLMFASQRWGLQPDLLVLAKGITSGYAPLGAVLAAPRVADRFFAGDDAPVFRHGLTYSGHATSCAVAEENLRILDQERLVSRAAHLETVLSKAVEPLRDHPLVVEVRAGAGFLAGVQLRPDVSGEVVAGMCVDDGVLMRPINGNTLHICPPFVASEDEVELIVTTLRSALDRIAPARPG